MKIIRNICRWLVGATFIFSGFVKVIDPMGYGYKIADYLEAMHLESIASISLTMAIILAVLELVIGLSLFFNLLPRLGALGSLLMLAFFTPLTLWLAIANPVSDCGCFGDALIITNWQTFFKNVILLAMTILIFVKRKKFEPTYHKGIQWVLMFIFGFASLGLGLYCLNNLPIIDFRPYHIGANIAEGMIVPEDAPKPVVESFFIYKKDGETKKFKIDELPDSTWTFVDAEHKIVDPGYIAPIHDFTMESTFFTEPDVIDPYDIEFVYKNAEGEMAYYDVSSIPDDTWTLDHYTCESYDGEIDLSKIQISYMNADEEIITMGIDEVPDRNEYEFYDAEYPLPDYASKDITSAVLADERYSFLMIALKLQDADETHLAEFEELAKYAKENNMGFYCMTSSNEEEITEFIEKHNPSYKFYNTDPITLKTIVRSNPGLLLIRKGTIIDKWHDGNLPTVKELETELTGTCVTAQHNQRDRLLYIVYILGALLFMSVIKNAYNWLKINRYINDNN